MADNNIDVFKMFAAEDRLDGDNYPMWAYMMQHVLVSKGIWNIVQGIDVHPGTVDVAEVVDVAGPSTRIAAARSVLSTAEQARCWDVKDAQAHALIALSVKRTITPHICSAKSAKQAWDILAGFHAGRNEAKIALLCKELESKIMNEEDDMDTFLVGIKDINEQLISAGEIISDSSLVQTTLDALPDSYQTFASTWRLMNQRNLDVVKFDEAVKKWVIELHEFEFSFLVEESTRATLANLLTYKESPLLIKEEVIKKVEEDVKELNNAHILFFDGSYRKSHDAASGGIALYDPVEAEQRAAQLAREKIKEALSRKAEEPVLEPTERIPKRPRQEEEEEIEHIHADSIPPSPINIPPAPPSSPITPFPPASTPQTPPSPLPHDIPKSQSTPTSHQQLHFPAESFDIPASLTEETAQPMETQTALQKETAQPMDKVAEQKQTNGEQHQPTKVDVPILIVQEDEPTNEEAIQEVKSFDYTRLIQTLSRQFQSQQVVAKETEIQKTRANQAQEEIVNLRTALELVTKERDSSARENENLLRDLIDLQSQLTRKEAQNHELIKNKKKMKEQLKYEDARFQKLNASYNTIKNTLTALLQNQEPTAAAPSTSDSAAVNTLAAL
ncbi:hypothetical protein L7F22_055458 [Adiantum nelumboides]|nr:hypothetical protein [Adiantum nelumboides]